MFSRGYTLGVPGYLPEYIYTLSTGLSGYQPEYNRNNQVWYPGIAEDVLWG